MVVTWWIVGFFGALMHSKATGICKSEPIGHSIHDSISSAFTVFNSKVGAVYKY